jgi:hypothetical protein
MTPNVNPASWYVQGKHDVLNMLDDKAASLYRLAALARDAGPHEVNVAYAINYAQRAAALSLAVRVALHRETHLGGLDWDDGP